MITLAWTLLSLAGLTAWLLETRDRYRDRRRLGRRNGGLALASRRARLNGVAWAAVFAAFALAGLASLASPPPLVSEVGRIQAVSRAVFLLIELVAVGNALEARRNRRD